MSSFCSVKCPICKNWMARRQSKKGQPILHCGHCGYAVLVLRKSTVQALDKVCEDIEEEDLPPKTLEKHRQRQQQQ